MNTNPREIWDVYQEWERLVKSLRCCEFYTITPTGDGRLSVDFILPDRVFKSPAEHLPVYIEPPDGGLVAEDFAL